MNHECAKCNTPIHVAPELEFDDDDLCWSCLDEEVREARVLIQAYRQSGALEALRRSQRYSALKPGCDCGTCRIELKRLSAIAALEAIEGECPENG